MKDFLLEINNLFYLFLDRSGGGGLVPKTGTSKIDLMIALNAALESAKRLPDGILKNG